VLFGCLCAETTSRGFSACWALRLEALGGEQGIGGLSATRALEGALWVLRHPWSAKWVPVPSVRFGGATNVAPPRSSRAALALWGPTGTELLQTTDLLLNSFPRYDSCLNVGISLQLTWDVCARESGPGPQAAPSPSHWVEAREHRALVQRSTSPFRPHPL
jgi:hypothetical protein